MEVTSTAFSGKLLQQARAVVAYSPKLARHVRDGTSALTRRGPDQVAVIKRLTM